MDNELKELCERVYEKTRWEDSRLEWLTQPVKLPNDHTVLSCIAPLYDSDFVLTVLENSEVGSDSDNSDDGRFYAKKSGNIEFADTPLKALLKLTLAVSDTGELEKGK